MTFTTCPHCLDQTINLELHLADQHGVAPDRDMRVGDTVRVPYSGLLCEVRVAKKAAVCPCGARIQPNTLHVSEQYGRRRFCLSHASFVAPEREAA